MTAFHIETKHTNFFLLLTCVLQTQHANASFLLTCIFAISSNKDKTDHKPTNGIICCKKPFHRQLQKAVGSMPRSKMIKKFNILSFKTYIFSTRLCQTLFSEITVNKTRQRSLSSEYLHFSRRNTYNKHNK